MDKIKPLETLDNTKVIVFKHLRDGALLLDKDDRVLFIKAKEINMGTTEDGATIINRLIDPGYQIQYRTLQIAKPRAGWNYKEFIEGIKDKLGIK